MRVDKSEAESYIEGLFVNEAIERKNILLDLTSDNKHGIQVSPGEGQLLKFFSKMIGAKKIVEIGTLYGYSTSWFVESIFEDLKENQSEEKKVWSFEKEESHFNIASKHLAHHIESKKLEIFLGDALTGLKSIESQGPFDLVFIDANKSGYMDYFDWADQNLRSGGLIIADNTFLFGEVFKNEPPTKNKKAWQVMRTLNETLARHENYISTLLPTAEGLTLAMKK